jgi:hypothetical protein
VAIAVRTIYCVDTSSFLYCQKSFAERGSRRDFFAPVWALLDQLADEGRLRAPHLVFGEISMNNDEIGRWAQAHRSVFRPKGEHAPLVVDILKDSDQRLVDPTGPRGGEEADPWVIALAEAISAVPPTLWDAEVGVVVSEELKFGGIADICGRRKVAHLDLAGMLVAENVSLGPPAR